MNLNKFFRELKRRSVYRVAIAYAVVSWLIIQVAVSTFPYLSIPDWCITALIWAIIIGFPVALILGWIYEMSPEGLVKTVTEEAQDNSLPGSRKKPFTSNLIIAILLLALIGQQAFIHFWNKESEQGDKSIAVLPFRTSGPNEEDSYIANVMMESIRDNLAKVETFKVPSSRSVDKYRQSNNKSIPQIGNELGVTYLIDGSVQTLRNKAKIKVNLIRAKDDHVTIIYSEEVELEEVLSLQSAQISLSGK